MQYRPLGASGIQASAVGFGAWAAGGWMWGGQDEREAIDAIRAAVDNGVTLIDTAPIYGFGASEELVGKAIAGLRDKVVLATKCGLVWDRECGDFYFRSNEKAVQKDPDKATKTVYRCLRPESIRDEVEASLRRLDVDVIDLYQTHWQESTTPIADTMGELMKLKDEGKIRAIGVSNASSEQMNEYRHVGPIDSDQERFSMLDRRIDSRQLPYCRERGIAILAYSPIEQGLLTGKMGPDREFEEGDMRRGSKRFSEDNLRKVQAMLDEFRPVAERHGITLAQLTIAWTIAYPGVTHALVGARNPKQAKENAAAADVQLSTEDHATIRQALAKHSGDIA